MPRPPERPVIRLAAIPGSGRIARRGSSVLFIPEPADASLDTAIELLSALFLADGPSPEVRSTDLPRCILEWAEPGGDLRVDSTIALVEQRVLGDDTPRFSATAIPIGLSVVERRERFGHAIATDLAHGDVASRGDLREGDVPAGGFILILPNVTPADVTAPPRAVAPASTQPTGVAEPPQFDELTDLDVTLAPLGPVDYPDDDTDRTFRRPGDVRCPRGHANANTNRTCRVCGDSLDSTADRPGPRASTAIAGLRLPDGSVVPINRTIAIGRSPTAEAARLDGAALLVAIDVPETVSRTHVVIRILDSAITVTDCDARGRTAVILADDPTPIALTPWEPCTVAIGDTIKLGGPTTLTITDPIELKVPPSLEPTAPPPERDETS